MKHITEEIYRTFAKELLDELLDRDYYNGSIEVDDGDETYRLTLVAMFYRRDVVAPDGRWSEIYDVVPIWWELRTFVGDDREEEINDAEFGRLKEYLV